MVERGVAGQPFRMKPKGESGGSLLCVGIPGRLSGIPEFFTKCKDTPARGIYCLARMFFANRSGYVGQKIPTMLTDVSNPGRDFFIQPVCFLSK